MSRILSKPSVEIDDIVIYIAPNSLKVKYGFGTKSVKTQSAGGNSTKLATSHNIEEAVGGITFEVFADAENVDRVLDLYEKNNSSEIGVKYFDTNNDISGTMLSSSLLNDPEHGYGADGKIELQLAGQPIKRG